MSFANFLKLAPKRRRLSESPNNHTTHTSAPVPPEAGSRARSAQKTSDFRGNVGSNACVAGLLSAPWQILLGASPHRGASIALFCVGGATLPALLLFLRRVATLERRAAELFRARAELSLQLDTILDSMTEGVVLLGSRREIVRINEAARRLLGAESKLTREEDAHALLRIFEGDGGALPFSEWPGAMALEGEFLSRRELQLEHRGTLRRFAVEVSTAPVPDLAANVAQVLICYRDISEAREVHQVRARLAAIVECSEDAVISKDENGMVTTWNAAAEKIFGYTAAEMIHQSIRRLVPPDRIHEEDQILKRIRNGETVEHIETIRQKKNGQFIHVSLTISPIRDASGKIVGASKIARNISDRKLLETRLYLSEKMTAIGQLTGSIAHDFNNLLGVIVGNLDLLERLVARDDEALKRVRTMQKAAERGAALTRRLLAFASREQLSPAPVSIEQSIRTTVELAARAMGSEFEIVTQIAPSTPLALVDLAGLESALLNLLVNARDAMPRGGRITLSAQEVWVREQDLQTHLGELKPGHYVYGAVSDTGIGMTRETLKRAFEPFFTTKGMGKGTGLGLAIAYGFFKQSGGLVRLYSEAGYGTTVSFYLPVADADSPSLQERMPVTRPANRRQGLVLLVDDEPSLLEVGRAFLEEAGIATLQAKDGNQALRIVREHPELDLIVTDVVMPGGMSGPELAQRARELRPGISVCFCSGFAAQACLGDALAQLNGPLLQKPYSRAAFLAMVEQAFFHAVPTPVASRDAA